MSADHDNIDDLSAEGIHTIAAQLSRQAVDRIVGIVRKQRQNGVSQQTLLKLLAKNLPDYDKHSLDLLLKLGSAESISDDFPDSNVISNERVKANTVELTLKSMPTEINLFSLVRHQGQEWLVVEAGTGKCTLKLLQ
jgi:hypothetical protein